MANWREHILQEFTPGVARLTLVADPDGLLLEEGILEAIRGRGFALLSYEDPVAFRYAYESGFRSRWDRGEEADLVVLLQTGAGELDSLPYDLLQVGRKLSFSLGDIFPDLSYPVVAALDRSDLDVLYAAQEKYVTGRLGDNATKEFILRHVFEIALEMIREPKDLLRVLLRRHYRGQRVPAVIDERFIQLLRWNDTFDGWPLEAIVPDREAFFAFLQERWPVFLDRMAAKAGWDIARETGETYGLAFAGPADLPFDDGDVRVYIDSLFLERLLQPLPHKEAAVLSGTWAGIGVRTDPAGDRQRRLGRLVKKLRSSLPAERARYRDWLRFARGWAELVALIYEPEEASDGTGTEEFREFRELQALVDTAFAAWLAGSYVGLINLPPAPPVMLHHVPRYLARYREENPRDKIALLVLDGLSFDQWITIREVLALKQPAFGFRENAVFAWIPTVTAVSRQAIFAARPPALFPDSIFTTEREPVLWMQFWVGQGLAQKEIVYARGLGDGTLENVKDFLSRPGVRIAGLVVDKVDRIMHGMELGTAGMHNQVRQWAWQSYLTDLLGFLLDEGFRVFLTSDHGNIEAAGCGRPVEGAAADLRGERVRVFSDALLREKVSGRFPGTLQWPSLGLPENYLPLIAPGRQAYVHRGERVICHGGLCLEEVIVPLVQVERLSAGSVRISADEAGVPAAGGGDAG